MNKDALGANGSISFSLNEAIQDAHSIEGVLSNLQNAANRSDSGLDWIFADKMKKAHQIQSDPVIDHRMKELLRKIEECPQNEILNKMRVFEKGERIRLSTEKGEWVSVKPRKISAACRKKSFYSTAIKYLLLFEEARQAHIEGKPSRAFCVNDILACRFIIDGDDVATIGFAFDLFNAILCFLEDHCYCNVLLTSSTVRTTEFDPLKHPSVIFPTEEMKVLERFAGKHKNYFAPESIKGNGYQALQAYVRDETFGFEFEVQVTTSKAFDYTNSSTIYADEINEDNPQTSHLWHKHARYGSVYDKQGILDYKSLQYDGFYYDPETGEITDAIMLLTPGIM